MRAMKDALAAAERRADDALRLLRTWVEQDSFTGAPDDVNAMGALLRQAFGGIPGLTEDVTAGNGVGDHLAWRSAAWDARPGEGVLLVGHHDTVFPPGTFSGWREDGDVARGPGVLDMKGGLVVVHTALAALAEAGRLDDVPVALVCVADEEIGSDDSGPHRDRYAANAGCALVFEAGRAKDAIITARKGTGGITVKVTGKAAHAGNHHADGVNAIWALARVVDAAQACTDYDAGLTVNVGLIKGGTSRNTVPAAAECGIDFRYEHAADGERFCDAMADIGARIAADTGAAIDILGGIRRPPMERTDGNVALYERYGAAARASGLGDAESPLLGGGSDGNNIAGKGIPVIDGLGPRGFGFHTHDEHIEMSSVAMRTAALIRFLLAD